MKKVEINKEKLMKWLEIREKEYRKWIGDNNNFNGRYEIIFLLLYEIKNGEFDNE